MTFSSAQATFHQTFDRDWNPAEMIDGTLSGFNGWAIYRNNGGGDQTLSESALFTLQNALASGPQSLTFTISQNYDQQHLLGDFSLGYTTDASPTLASAETLFTINGASSLNGSTFTFPTTGNILVGGAIPNTDVYTIEAGVDSATPITGIFLNAINDPANGLPTGGPGRQPNNGNFVISEFQATSVAAVPEPGSIALLTGMAVTGAAFLRRRKQAAKAARTLS